MYRKKIHSAIWQKMRRNGSTRDVWEKYEIVWIAQKTFVSLRIASIGTLDADDRHYRFALSVRLVPLPQQTDLLGFCPSTIRRVPLIWQTEFVADVRVLLQAGARIQHKCAERSAQPKPPVNKMILKKVFLIENDVSVQFSDTNN